MLGYPQVIDAIDPLPVRKPAPAPVRGPVWWRESDHVCRSDEIGSIRAFRPIKFHQYHALFNIGGRPAGAACAQEINRRMYKLMKSMPTMKDPLGQRDWDDK
jgi:hypothetical protein